MSETLDEANFMREGMRAIRRLTWDKERNNTLLIGEIADAMHNGFDPRDALGQSVAVGELNRIQSDHPELKKMMPATFAWASSKGAD